ncbi:hypothetical protein G7075_05385 [Phycicoccus sp. HDW14]|uniref:hypothetical protein n=1 Tax=Phycicoccus sp. HDW14 TaxID=2714941 RepID=UPI00140C46E4|nr:hypothetical protein [Phycicoccus sp. HDW14]QIM20714.1 hypothetical protein G7075_05385 [Phycicoccus sp. HDW14]
MQPVPTHPPYDQFLATADWVADHRPEVDREMAREVFGEAATLLHDGLVLDDLDVHDAAAVVTGLCLDLVAPDPGAAIRERAARVGEQPGDLHDPASVARCYEIVVRLFRL